MNGADTAWIMVATALVLFMTLPGLALFYGGLVRARNVLSVFTQCFGIACLMSLLWLAVGYSIAFGDHNSYWGGLGKLFILNLTPDTLSGTIPEVLFFSFQMTFAIITPALIVGAYVERISFAFVMMFSGLWMLLVYAPVTHWVWGGGLLSGSDGSLFENGVKDFAGGIVVHETAGLAALVLAFILGPRRNKSVPPHNPGYVMLGAAMLWVGWFGFNGGSQLAADGGAAMAITVTHISAAAASLTWALYERIKYGRASLVGMVTGTIAGLASITPASGWVSPLEALIIGAIAGVLCQIICGFIKRKLNIDDTLDVFAVHGIGGIFGTIMLAGFGYAGWTEQLGSIFIVGLFTIVMTTLIVKGLATVITIRVSEEDEISGLDRASHGERAYDLTS
ncbi:MAG: ammonium transporter [Proteobacteria bacterium]|jgi:Amt family ammonium transporter|nr:ammonium transporter [Pseudomonadota bacterium]MDA1238814.1 ammonium transporter [Pseudomonadota bacterium]